MHLIVAIIRPHRLEPVREALQEANVIGLTVSDCRGTGRHRSVTHSFRGSQYTHGLDPRVRLEVLVREDQLTEAVDAIREAAATGEVGDGKIIVLQAADVVRIRTNERGETALS